MCCYRRIDQELSAGNYGRCVRAHRTAPVSAGGQGAYEPFFCVTDEQTTAVFLRIYRTYLHYKSPPYYICLFWYRRTGHRYCTTVPTYPYFVFTGIPGSVQYPSMYALVVFVFRRTDEDSLQETVGVVFEQRRAAPRGKWWKRRLRTVFFFALSLPTD